MLPHTAHKWKTTKEEAKATRKRITTTSQGRDKDKAIATREVRQNKTHVLRTTSRDLKPQRGPSRLPPNSRTRNSKVSDHRLPRDLGRTTTITTRRISLDARIPRKRRRVQPEMVLLKTVVGVR